MNACIALGPYQHSVKFADQALNTVHVLIARTIFSTSAALGSATINSPSFQAYFDRH